MALSVFVLLLTLALTRCYTTTNLTNSNYTSSNYTTPSSDVEERFTIIIPGVTVVFVTTTKPTTTTTTPSTTETATTTTINVSLLSTAEVNTTINTCVENCTCSGLWARCSGAGLETVTGYFPSSTRAIDLSRNRLSSFRTDAVKYCSERLLYLDLAYNRYLDLPLALFKAAANIQALDVSHNLLNNDVLLHNPFSALNKLQFLDLSYNKISFISYLLLATQEDLRTIILDGNGLVSASLLPYGALSRLQFLSMANNSISSLDFEIRTSLGKLDVRENNFSFQNSSKPFLLTTKLTHLLIGHWGLMFYPETFSGLEKLTTLYIEDYTQEVFDDTILSPVADTITNLTLCNGTVREVVLEDLNSLSHASFINLDELRAIRIENCPLSLLQVDGLSSLNEVVLQNLRLPNLTQLVSANGTLKKLTVNEQTMHKLTDVTFAQLNNLVYIDFSLNQIRQLSGNLITSLVHLTKLILTKNALTVVPSNFLRSESLVALDLSENFIREIASDAFSSLPAIKTVDLTGNEIKTIGRFDINPLAVVDLPKNNNWNCTCELYAVIENDSVFNITCQSQSTCFSCTSPNELYGKPYNSLKERCENIGSVVTTTSGTFYVDPISSTSIAIGACIGAIIVLAVFAILMWKFCRLPEFKKSGTEPLNTISKGNSRVYESIRYSSVKENVRRVDNDYETPENTYLQPMKEEKAQYFQVE